MDHERSAGFCPRRGGLTGKSARYWFLALVIELLRETLEDRKELNSIRHDAKHDYDRGEKESEQL